LRELQQMNSVNPFATCRDPRAQKHHHQQ
jgi:hypothetical protein